MSYRAKRKERKANASNVFVDNKTETKQHMPEPTEPVREPAPEPEPDPEPEPET